MNKALMICLEVEQRACRPLALQRKGTVVTGPLAILKRLLIAPWFAGAMGSLWTNASTDNEARHDHGRIGVRLSPMAIGRLSVIAIATYVILAGMILATARNGVDINNIPLGFDFNVFYAFSKLAADGQAAAAFQEPVLFEAMATRLTDPQLASGYLWLYPPTYAVLLLPLAVMPFGAAFWVFTGAGLLSYSAASYYLCRKSLGVLAALGFSAVWVNAYHGQNAFFTAALFMVTCRALLQRDDRLAGIAIGLLVIKPHLAVLLPLLLAVAGRWRCFAWAGGVALGFLGLSVAVLGLDYLDAFISHRHIYATLMERAVHWQTTASLFAAVRLLGGGEVLALIVHGCTALIAAGLVLWRVRRAGLTTSTLAMAIGASLMVSPYIADYDLTILAAAGLVLFAYERGAEVTAARTASDTPYLVALSIAIIPIMVVTLGREGLQLGWLAPLLTVIGAGWCMGRERVRMRAGDA